MYKVLIVDDEILVRVGLKTTIDWESIGFNVVAEASNGEQGYLQYKKHSPDIIITDIKMPKKDGIWLIEEVRKENKNTKILVLTCYDEFAIARKALKAGADDYILKFEIEDEELVKVMENLKLKLDENINVRKEQIKVKSNQNAVKRALLNDMIKIEFKMDEKITERCIGVEFDIEDTKFAFASIAINEETVNEETLKNNFRQINNAIVNIIFDKLSDGDIQYIYNNHMKKYIFMMSKKNLSSADLKRNFIAINNAVKQYFNISLNIIYTDPFSHQTNILNEYREFAEKTQIRFFDVKAGEEVMQTSNINFSRAKVFDLKNKYNPKFNEFIGRENKERALELIYETSKIFQDENVNPKIIKIFYLNLVGDIFSSYAKLFESSNEVLQYEKYHYRIENCEKVQKLEKILEEFITISVSSIRNSRHSNGESIISRAIDFIQNNYEKKISLENVAAEVHLSKHYLCNVFKKETGENVSLYINKLRITKAKKLILEKDAKIKNIYELVGYSNQQYFSKVFKKITGMTVMEYKKVEESQSKSE